MENEKIQLRLNKTVSVELSSDTPDMQTMIDIIVENRTTINIDDITVSCSDDIDFDKEGFEEMIKEVIKQYLETLRLEESHYQQIIESLNV